LLDIGRDGIPNCRITKSISFLWCSYDPKWQSRLMRRLWPARTPKILKHFYVYSESQKENFDAVWVTATSFQSISYSSFTSQL